ncbi:MAG: hypothetical protein HZA93_07060 [Verrucomicrobia bacterium]|nr:hypothetical protein [Verrucomicrobiota bacterium]
MPRSRLLIHVFALSLAVLFGPTTRAMSVVPPTADQLVAAADTIVRGVVTEVRTEEFDSPQGRGIRTLVTLKVERALKGTPGDTITLSLLGGKFGRRTLRIVGMPEFHVGARQLVFISGNGTSVCPLVSGGHGRYHVQQDAATGRTYVARDNGLPLESADEISVPLDAATAALSRLKSPARALALDEFESKITALRDQLPQATPQLHQP